MAEKRIYSVSQVNSYLGHMFREDFVLRRIRVRGELSNVKYHSSGHIYFTMKDQGGTLAAVMFAGQRRGLSFEMREGQKVVVTGSVEVYERGGVYQLYASSVEEEGRGDLYAEFLRLKRELEEMGMFAQEYKKPIPKYAKSVGIVTSATGAAVRDIINISKRRDPYIQLVLYPAVVQGDRAADSIVRGIRTLDRYGVDVIIAGRGGGSIEDLWAFNEERVARAIFECETPVISAVGHETDFTIADFAADLRAPTPSAAAELAVPDIVRFLRDLQGDREALDNAMRRKLERFRGTVRERELRLRLHSPGSLVRQRRSRCEELRLALAAAMKEKHYATVRRFDRDTERLRMLSPLDRLKGGFAYVTGEDGRAVKTAGEISAGRILSVRFRDGSVRTEVKEVIPAEGI